MDLLECSCLGLQASLVQIVLVLLRREIGIGCLKYL